VSCRSLLAAKDTQPTPQSAPDYPYRKSCQTSQNQEANNYITDRGFVVHDAFSPAWQAPTWLNGSRALDLSKQTTVTAEGKMISPQVAIGYAIHQPAAAALTASAFRPLAVGEL